MIKSYELTTDHKTAPGFSKKYYKKVLYGIVGWYFLYEMLVN